MVKPGGQNYPLSQCPVLSKTHVFPGLYTQKMLLLAAELN